MLRPKKKFYSGQAGKIDAIYQRNGSRRDTTSADAVEPNSSSDLTQANSASESAKSTDRERTSSDVRAVVLEKLQATCERADKTFFDILDLLVSHGVPTLDLTRYGIVPGIGNAIHVQGARQYISYPLGSGHSCTVVQHELSEDIASNTEPTTHATLLVPKGTVVALKFFRPVPVSDGKSDEREATRKTHKAIQRELEVLCHPVLRNHANICSLLFTAWGERSRFPMLALELAAFGTLEDVLCAQGTGPSMVQKTNMTIDIYLGVTALHSTNTIHGDIKPANITIHHHDSRQLIAKLTDFGGSALADQPGGSTPTLGTSLWSAPELLAECNTIDWLLNDVYAVGLVVGSLWARPYQYMDPLPSSCILERALVLKMDDQEKASLIALMKSQPDESTYSVRGLCRSFLRCQDASVKSALFRLFDVSVARQPEMRKPIAEVVDRELLVVANIIGRPLSIPSPPCVDRHASQSRETRPSRFRVWDESYLNRSKAFHTFYFEQMLDELSGFDNILQLAPLEITLSPAKEAGPAAADEFLDSVIDIIRSRGSQLLSIDDRAITMHLARLAFHVSVSAYLGTGTQRNEVTALRWLQASAAGGHLPAILFADVLHYASPMREQIPNIGSAFTVISALCGGKHSRALLRNSCPRLYQQVSDVSAYKTWVGKSEPAGPYGIFTLVDLRNTTPTFPESVTLHEALQRANSKRVRELLAETTTDIPLLDRTSPRVMHLLAQFEHDDQSTAGLARLCFSKGARLDGLLDDADGLATSPFTNAVRAGMPCLALTILALHENSGVPVADDHTALLVAAAGHHAGMIYALITTARRTPALLPGIYQCLQDAPLGLAEALHFTLGGPGLLTLRRRSSHGPDFLLAKQVTIALLLKFGADPWIEFTSHGDTSNGDTSDGDSAMMLAEHDDDATALMLFLRFSQSPLDGSHKAIIAANCICNSALECLSAVLSAFPDVVNSKVAGFTLLSLAVREADPSYTSLLIQQGADFTSSVVQEDGSSWSPLARALIDGRVRNASLIYNRFTPQQRKALWHSEKSSGITTFARVLQQWILDRNPRLLDSVKWLHTKDAAFFISRLSATSDPTVLRGPAWHLFLHRAPPLTQNERLWDKAMLKVLLDMFPDRVDDIDQSNGMAPIHTAACFAKLELVELLVERGANVNVETPAGQGMSGWTAFDLAVDRSNMLPSFLKNGGRIAVESWRKQMNQIVRYLAMAGARNGGGAEARHRVKLWEFKIKNTRVVMDSAEEDEALRGAWPVALPKDNASDSAIDRSKMWMRRADGEMVCVERFAKDGIMQDLLKVPKPAPTLCQLLKSQSLLCRERWSNSGPHLRATDVCSETASLDTLLLEMTIRDPVVGQYEAEIDLMIPGMVLREQRDS